MKGSIRWTSGSTGWTEKSTAWPKPCPTLSATPCARPTATAARNADHDEAAARKPALGLDPRVAAGTPEDVAKVQRSYTGQFLAPVLARGGRQAEEVRGWRRRSDAQVATI